jgi:hypothetical protein
MAFDPLPPNTAAREQLITPPAVGPMPSGPAIIVPPSDPFADDKRLVDRFKALKDEAYDNRWVYERKWWQQLLYLLGRQWIYYDARRGQWVDKRMARWIPRPVTNLVLETHDAICAVFEAVDLRAKARPIGTEPENVQTAETADALEPALAEEHQMRRVMRDHDFWLVATGNVFLRPWWDKRANTGVFTVPYEECLACHARSLPRAVVEAGDVCPACGASALIPARDEQGQPIVETFAAGRGCTTVLSPFEVAVPAGFPSLDEVPYAIIQRWRTRTWAEANLPEAVVKRIQWEQMPAERSLQLVKALASQSDIGVGPLALALGSESKAEGYVEYELMMRPSKDFPDGALIRFCGQPGQELVVRWEDESIPGPLPYVTRSGERIFNLIHTTYKPIAGRIWGVGPLEAILQKQDQYNQLDSLIQLIVQRMANPVWLEPKGAEVKKFTGEPGLVVKYNPLTAGNAKPEKIEGSNIPISLLQYRDRLRVDIENQVGTHDVVKGAKPVGVEAFSALQLLVERAQSRFAVPLAERGATYRAWVQIALELERLYGPDTRVRWVLGPNASWTLQTFQRAHLHGAVEFVIEDGSQLPKTSLGNRAAIEQLRQMNALNFADPEVQYAVLRTFGQTQLIPSLDYHVKAALQEQDAFERWARTTEPMPRQQIDPMTGQMVVTMSVVPPPVNQSGRPLFGRKPWHNDAVHLNEHTKWLNSDRMRALLDERPWVEPLAAQLLAEHQMAILTAQMGGPPAPSALPDAAAQPGGGGRALGDSNRESGNPSDVPRGTGERADNRGPE